MVRQLVTNIFKQMKSGSTRTIPPVPKQIWQDPLYFIAFGFGTGAIAWMPGTFGTLMAIPFYLLLRPLPLPAYVIFVIAFIIFASWLSHRISRTIAEHDHPGMNIDEFAGFFVTMINAPPGWGYIVLGFILFRFFDIFKPWPISYLDKNVHGGFGMVLDDVVAGLFSLAILQIIRLLVV